MKIILSGVDQLSWVIVLLLCVTIGLAPFSPPHIIEKLTMLITGTLTQPLDIFDLCFHGFPWIILILKLFVTYNREKKQI
ncbi:MAG: RND transporter [Proteobacteria bacterium]|nr:RND transporter [Pseudomonadota bacterium]